MQEQEITLSEILIAREERVAVQTALLGKYKAPVISFTMNMAGPVKLTALSHRAFLWGCEQLRLGFVQNKFPVLAEQTRSLPTGDEAYFAVDAPAEKVKALCVEIEESSPAGRFCDMDVIGLDGRKLERGTERPCIVCGKPGRDCASRRLHTVKELQRATKTNLGLAFLLLDRRKLSGLATHALLEEVAVTPKPGLVDRANNGAHQDMDFSSFQASAAALTSYWEACFQACHSEQSEESVPPAASLEAGTDPSTSLRSAQDDRQWRLSPAETFSYLRPLGKQAERDMLAATGGVNTHKGAIFTLGVLCGAIGRRWTAEEGFPSVDVILDEAAAMTRETLAAELPAANWHTAGEALYRIDPEMTQLCRVETFMGRGRVLELPESLRTLIRNAWYYYPYDYYSGTYDAGTGELTVSHVYAAETSMTVRVQSVELSDNADPASLSDRITLELISDKDQYLVIDLTSRQSDDNLAVGNSKKLTFTAGEVRTLYMNFGGWTNYPFYVTVTADNTRVELRIVP